MPREPYQSAQLFSLPKYASANASKGAVWSGQTFTRGSSTPQRVLTSHHSSSLVFGGLASASCDLAMGLMVSYQVLKRRHPQC